MSSPKKLTFKASKDLIGCNAFPPTSSISCDVTDRKVVLSDTNKSVNDLMIFWSVSDNCKTT